MTSAWTSAPTVSATVAPPSGPPAVATRRRTAGPPPERGARHRRLAVALVAAPAVWLVAWTLMRVDGSRGPGWGWTAAHVAFLVASTTYAVAAVLLARTASGGPTPAPAVRLVVGAACTAAVAGAAAFVGQAAIDLYVGAHAATRDAMHDVYAPILAVPGVETWLFGVGPSLLFAGVFVLVLVAALRRRVPGAAAWLFGVGNLAQVAGRTLPPRFVALEGVGIGLEVLALGVAAAGAHDPRHGR
ncbi:hypothetical protein Cch01nite_40930 [Cellulomonas chitinilytica]|uniref:DUF4386 family protein n=1 Tax=Cellulomonas chitinilytica TaxID=398759 RepID=A0A919P9I8_9CELL|nr:hypothetical protein [Cellulomonas chitinilytica]GIG23369.1 hypothetical protein Cch01nite_40930 [Cellulomonas chitinilytica]